jgi:small subunit ribosomal protein S18
VEESRYGGEGPGSERPYPPRRRSSDDGDGGDEDREERGGGRRRFAPRRRVCTFCVEHVDYIDYKKVDMLRRYLTDRGKIKARRKTGVCAKHQRRLAIAIKRARHLAMLPFTSEHSR